MKVDDLMHTGDALPCVNADVSLRDALMEVTRGGLGITAVVDPQQNCSGLHRRRPAASTGCRSGPEKYAGERGHDPGGKRIAPGTLAAEAAHIMQTAESTPWS